jgi:hypothetical protein
MLFLTMNFLELGIGVVICKEESVVGGKLFG